MTLDVILRGEIEAKLISTGVAVLTAAAAHGGANVEYCRGILDVLRAIAMHNRVSWQAVEAAIKTEVRGSCQYGLLEILSPPRLT